LITFLNFQNRTFENPPPSPYKLLFAKISGEANFTVPFEFASKASKNLSSMILTLHAAVASSRTLVVGFWDNPLIVSLTDI
jgi:hypothetical protein